MLTREAWNALLKVLEEPPPGVVFVFATTEPQKIAAAAAPVLSRLQRFDFRRIGPAAIRDRLRQVLDAEGIAADDDALTLIARHADGGMRDALSRARPVPELRRRGRSPPQRVREVLGLVGDELYAEVLRPRRGPAAGGRLSAGRSAGRTPARTWPSSWAGRAKRSGRCSCCSSAAEPEGLTEAMRGALERYRDRLEPGDLLRMLRLLAESETAIRRSANPRLIVETLLLRWTMLDRIVDLAQVLERGSGRSAGRRVGGRPGGRPPPESPWRAKRTSEGDAGRPRRYPRSRRTFAPLG